MPQGNEPGVGRQVLKGQGVEPKEDADPRHRHSEEAHPRQTWPQRDACAPIARPMADPNGLMGWVALLSGDVREWLRWASHHTGLPVIVVAAMALVTSWHLFRRTLRFAVEVAVAAVLLLAATKLGLISW
jgi:hypothetical protein